MAVDVVSRYFGKLQNEYKANATEHSYRPALKELVEGLVPGVRATNEPKREKVGAPDYIVTRRERHGELTLGHIEAKDIGRLEANIERGEQMKRYLAYFPNLVLTDYLEFRWYVDGAKRETARLGHVEGGRLVLDKGGKEAVEGLLRKFILHKPQPIGSAKELALRMARLTHIIRDMIVGQFEEGLASNLLVGWREAFARVLIADLDQPEKTGEFADMFAQTLAYGLFSARVMDTTPRDFSRREAQ